jgi:putative sugar O-methyltransferase
VQGRQGRAGLTGYWTKISVRQIMTPLIIKALRNPRLAIGSLLRLLRKILPASKEFVCAENLRSASEDGLYIKAVQNAIKNYKAFRSFKSHPDYQKVLEHVSFDQGQLYLEILKTDSPEIIDTKIKLLKLNDLVGNPRKYEYDVVGEISPTTLRYAKVASDLKVLFGSLHKFSIAEIGCGYGGQMLVIDQMFDIQKYLLFDLPPVIYLIQKYLESHLLNSSYETSTLNQCDNRREFDLVISNYAFSELPLPLQIKYIEKVLLKSKRGYLTMNSGLTNSAFGSHLKIDDFRKYLPDIEISEEKPLTKPDNYIIIWGRASRSGY